MKMKKRLYDAIYSNVSNGSISEISASAYHKGMELDVDGEFKTGKYDEIESDLYDFAWENAGMANSVNIYLYIKDNKLMASLSHSMSHPEDINFDDFNNDIQRVTKEYIKKKKGESTSIDYIDLRIYNSDCIVDYYDEDGEVYSLRCFKYFIDDIYACLAENLERVIKPYTKNLTFFYIDANIECTRVIDISCSWTDNDKYIIECGE